MKVAIIGAGMTMLGRYYLSEILHFIEDEPWKLEVSDLNYTFDEFVEPTPYVGGYQSRNERSVIWAVALKQFRRR